MGIYTHVVRCVGRQIGGEVKEIHGGGMKRCSEEVSRKKEAHKAMCQGSTEENKRRY